MERETGIEPVTSGLGSWQQRFALRRIKRLEWGLKRQNLARAALIPLIEHNFSLLYTADRSLGAEIQALVEHHLNNRPGDWRVSIVCPRESDGWEMKVWGPNGCLAEMPQG